MRKVHHNSLKIHTVFNIIIWTLYSLILVFNSNATLIISVIFLLIYITGNGLIHSKKNQLSRDTLVEYIILSAIALVILVNALIK